MPQVTLSVARWIAFSVLLLLSVTLQAMVFPRIDAVPNPMVSVAAVVSLAVFTGTAAGAAAGAVCGMLCDALLHGEAYFTLTMMGAGALTGSLCGKVLQRKFLPALALSAASACVIAFFYIVIQVAVGRAPWGAIISVGLPEVLASIGCVPLVYPLFRAAAKYFAKDESWKGQN
jgi:rod shape-determining protein MreD